ncbi:MAG: membrane protein insertion efficiency factor YidD [Alphaproteobacteria bacterium]|nr:membrane protein insertion efficiency factor YidD [Alphaproteobacteria bacterium]
MRKIPIFIILFYRHTISYFIGRSCRFEPSCSQYTIDAINKYGVLRGIYKGIKRILRCRPGGGSGYDPV